MYYKKYKVITKQGKSHGTLFDTLKTAISTIGVSNIQKIEEVNISDSSDDKIVDKKIAMLLTKRSDDDINISKKSGYTVSYVKPVNAKLFDGMKVIEVGETTVLVATLKVISRYEASLYPAWDSSKYDSTKEWDWVLLHKGAKLMKMKEAIQQFGDLSGSTSGTSYIKLKKITQ